MVTSLARWPFLPEVRRAAEENKQWWQTCYVPSPADGVLQTPEQSAIAFGGPGSGKTTALKALERTWAKNFLPVSYPVERWPGGKQVWASGYGHLGQIMACAGQVVKKSIVDAPETVAGLSDVKLEFLRFLIQQYDSSRAFLRWADALKDPARKTLLNQEFKVVYETDTNPPDVQGQIEELVTLSRILGFEGVVVLIDVPPSPQNDAGLRNNLKDLFGRLTLFEHQGFVFKAALPETLVDELKLVDLTRGRVHFARLAWQQSDCRQIIEWLIRAASGHPAKLDDLAAPELIQVLEKQLENLFGATSPQGSAWLAETILTAYSGNERRLTKQDSEQLLQHCFTSHVPLRLDPARQSIWRGPQEILLDEQPLRILKVLWQYRGSAYDANDALMDVAGSRANLNTIISRLRQKIEPIPGTPIYLHNSRGRGYWLENVIQFDESVV
jgi:DNA-binding winged helix-turn-helix (wHTH) protein